MKNLVAGGFLFVGGAILMLGVETLGVFIHIGGILCAMLGAGTLIYYLFSDNGKYPDDYGIPKKIKKNKEK